VNVWEGSLGMGKGGDIYMRGGGEGREIGGAGSLTRALSLDDGVLAASSLWPITTTVRQRVH